MTKEFTIAAITVFALLLVGCGCRGTLLWAAVIYTITVVVAAVIVTVGFHTHRRCPNTDIVDSCWHGHAIWTVVVVWRGLMHMVGSIPVTVVTRMGITVGIQTVGKLANHLHALFGILSDIPSCWEQLLSNLYCVWIVIIVRLAVGIVLSQQGGVMPFTVLRMLFLVCYWRHTICGNPCLFLWDIASQSDWPCTRWGHTICR